MSFFFSFSAEQVLRQAPRGRRADGPRGVQDVRHLRLPPRPHAAHVRRERCASISILVNVIPYAASSYFIMNFARRKVPGCSYSF